MGGKKGAGKKSSVFKVAGAKSFKIKSKAKPVIGNLRKINEIVRKNIDKTDKNLVNLQYDLRQKKEEEKAKPNSNQNKNFEKEFKAAADFDEEKQKTFEKLNEMQF